MEKLKRLSEEYQVPYAQLEENRFLISKFLWPYEEAHSFQKKALNILKESKNLEIFISTSHPHCFTLGRGLQKKKGKVIHGLVEFNSEITLPFPVHHIERGGGLTFHYPGQWVLYPLVNLTAKAWTLPKLISWILEASQKILSTYSSEKIEVRLEEKTGLWVGEKKIGSLGFALERFITFHGFALNLAYDEKMFHALTNIYPCGFSGNTYHSLDHFSSKKLPPQNFEKLFFQL